jgi:mannose/fructose/N-acetylgalactosamine-specific phosphotransferase system component IIB
MIQFIRVDDRVIHGQTIACWINEFPCNGIILVDDKLAGDTVMGNIYRNAVPSDIKVHIFTVDKALQKLDEIKISQKIITSFLSRFNQWNSFSVQVQFLRMISMSVRQARVPEQL